MNNKININDIDLSNIKVAVFDFDETLAIHSSDKHYAQEGDEKLDYYVDAYLKPDVFYDELEPCMINETLLELINILREKGIKIYCLSGMKYAFHLKAKQLFVNKHYGNDIETVAVGSQELKIDGLKIIKKINNCELDEILFIDDKDYVVDSMKEYNINALLVSDLVYNKMR